MGRQAEAHGKSLLLRGVIKEGQLTVTYVPSEHNLADCLTKALPIVIFARLQKGLNLKPRKM